MSQIILKASESSISEGMIFIENSLKEKKIDKKSLVKTLLLCEELLVQMIKHADSPDTNMHIDISRSAKSPSISISCKGEKYDLAETEALNNIVGLHEVEDDEQISVISHLILKSQSEKISLKYSNGINKAVVRTGKAESSNKIISFMLFGIVTGLIFKFFIPASVTAFANTYIFSIGQELFMDSIKMVVGPLVFFSIAESMMGFSDYTTFGRIGTKIIGLYFLTTMMAIGIAYAVFQILKPGDPSQAAAVMEMIGTVPKQAVAEVSIRDTIVEIIPTNFVSAFLNSDMLQIIFVGVFVGIVSGLLGESSGRIQTFIKDGNTLFSRMTTAITKFMPVAVFCIMANVMLSIGVDSLLSLIKAFAVTLIGIGFMIVFYMLFLSVAAGLSPFIFFKKYKDALIMAFSTASSNATMPVSMLCLDKIGVSKKVYAFSIPLGATINMNGTSVFYTIMTLFMARIFDIQLDSGLLFSVFVSVFMLSIGTPGVPGASIACLAMLFSQIGVAPEAVGYIMIISTLGDFFQTASDVVGDAVVTTVVAKTENLLDIDKFKS